MKKIILAFAIVVLSVSMNAQTFKHYTLNDMNNDTIAYLQKNFIDQKTYFIGKPLSRVLDIYIQDLPLNYSASDATTPWENPQDATEYIKGISISWLTEEEGKALIHNKIYKTMFLDIVFEPPYKERDWDVWNKYGDGIERINHLKNYIVKEIKL